MSVKYLNALIFFPIMKSLNLVSARKFALDLMKNDPEYISHIESMISIIEQLASPADIPRLTALAWLHDLGRSIASEDHAKHSLQIVSKNFSIDKIDQDCILNHGSSASPSTPQGTLFRYCDGLSRYTPSSVQLYFYRCGVKGITLEQAKEKLTNKYHKLLARYQDEKIKIRLRKMAQAVGIV
jgi:hypothetical protein